MKLIKFFLVLLFVFSCHSKNENIENKNIPEIFKSNYGKIDDKNLKLRFGDIVEFNVDNKKIEAIVLDVKNEKSVNWFGLCFLNGNKIFGRKIPQGYGGECIDLLDISYINERGLKDFKIIKKEKINFEKVGLGSDSPIINLQQISRDYLVGIEKRKLKETPCEEKVFKLNPINECYFDIRKIK